MARHQLALIFLCVTLFGCTQLPERPRAELINDVVKLQTFAKTINDSSWLQLNQAEELISKIDNAPDSLAIMNLFFKGYYLDNVQKKDSASHYFHQSISLINADNNKTKYLNYFRYATEMDFANGKYTNAISTGNLYLKVLEEIDDSNGKIYVYNLFERVYIQLKDYEKALLNNEKCIAAAEQAKNIEMLAISRISKAKYLYNYFGQVKDAYSLLDSIVHSENELSISSKIQLHYERGNLKFKDEFYQEAIKDYQETLNFINASNQQTYYTDVRSQCFINMSEAFTYLGNKTNAKKFLDLASNLVYENRLSDYYVDLAKQRMRYKNIDSGNIDAILADIDSIERLNNSTYAKRMNEELLALKASNEREILLAEEKQETEISNLKLKSRNILLSVVVALILLIGYIIYRQRKYRFQRQSLQMQQRLLRSQMNPHFMSNTLYAIQNTIKKDQDGSVNYLTKFSRLLRLILENSMQNYVLLEKEIESLKKYMDLQLLRFPEAFDYSIELNDVDDEISAIPPMLIQPFVENSIEHGFFGIDYKGHIKIKLSHSKNYLHCTIEDNGTGLTNVNNSKKQSASSELISDFIFKATKSKISVLDKKSINKKESGTQIQFLIPYKILEHD